MRVQRGSSRETNVSTHHVSMSGVIQEIVEQTLADLVRVADTIDVHSNPKVASFASRVSAQIETLRREHDATVIFFFNESPETISELPSLPIIPFKITEEEVDEVDEEAPCK